MTSEPKTFIRGLRIMEILRNAGAAGLSIPTIAKLSDIERTTVYRYIDVLVAQGYVHPAGADRIYVFNHERFLQKSVLHQSVERLKPVLQRISAECGDTSFLIRRDGGDSWCVHREVGSYPVQVFSVTLGHRQPLGVGSAGLALLANLPRHEIDEVLRINQDRLRKFGRMTVNQLEHLINATLERGWAVVANAAVPGVLGVGVPIFGRLGIPVFAVSVSSIMERMPIKRQRFIVDLIKKELAAVDLRGLSD